MYIFALDPLFKKIIIIICNNKKKEKKKSPRIFFSCHVALFFPLITNLTAHKSTSLIIKEATTLLSLTLSTYSLHALKKRKKKKKR